MMGIGFSELLVILVIIMIIFGAGKLPEIGSAFGKSIKNFKQSMKEAEAEEQTAAVSTEPPAATSAPASPAAGATETKKSPGKSATQAEGDLIDQAIKEATDNRIHTIHTRHDGLVQEKDVFTESVKKVPFGMKGRDSGVSRDIL